MRVKKYLADLIFVPIIIRKIWAYGASDFWWRYTLRKKLIGVSIENLNKQIVQIIFSN